MNSTDTFFGLGLAPNLLERLEKLNFVNPTPIQFKSIPVALKGEDLIGIAQTGTGKTLSFSLPMMQRLASLNKRGLILCPTRELALQVDKTLQKIGHALKLRTATIIGGVRIDRQIAALRKNPHILVATPGRLIDHLQQKTITLDQMGILVMDEADRMLDMGFLPQIKQILESMPAKRQTLLFSATMPPGVSKIARQYMQQPVRVEVAPAGTTADKIDQELFVVPRYQKMALLERLLDEYFGTVLVFSRTKHGAKKIAQAVNKLGHSATELHSNRTLGQRKRSLEGFKTGKYRVMVATDIAARGIDVKDIELVINYDLPDSADDYVHRIGRTGRAGKEGKAISFANPDQSRDVNAIEKLIQIRIPIASVPHEVKNIAPKKGENTHTPQRRGGGAPQRGGGSSQRRRPRRGSGGGRRNSNRSNTSRRRK